MNQITDAKPLAGLKELKNIGLEFNKITDLTPLADLTKLEVIRLHNNKITDLTSLGGLKQAVHIDLRANAGLTKGEIKKLQKALPKCQIPNQAK
jgi:Leucine-rich repeat (LRR) protein